MDRAGDAEHERRQIRMDPLDGRACPEKWPADFPRRAQHAHRPTILAEHLIGPDDFTLPLSELAVGYPAPEPVSRE
jgi:hypothetical protein